MVNINGNFATRGGEKLLIKLIAIILIGKCLLLLADEKDILVYVKLATLLVFLTTMLDFLKL
jgi:hypothetical protein